jgi:tripartite-type tricarboxylate transporter receptor subunit TctC
MIHEQPTSGAVEIPVSVPLDLKVRRYLLLAGALVLGCSSPVFGADASYPTKLVRMIVPFAAGGSTDLFSRTVAQLMSDAWKQSVIVDNRPGGGAIPGTMLAVKAPPDGYTLLVGTVSTHAVNPALHPKLPYDALKDFAPISELVYIPQLLSVHPSLPVKSVRELVALAKARPGEINYASGGMGATPHMSMELFQLVSKTQMTRVNYRGSGPAMIGMLSGEAQVMFDAAVTTIPHMRSGKLRTLAITTLKRSALLPDIPTVAESGYPGFETLVWFGLFAPAGTPPEIMTRIHETVSTGLSAPAMRDRLTANGFEIVVSTPAEFAKRIAREIEKWRGVVQANNIKVEF